MTLNLSNPILLSEDGLDEFVESVKKALMQEEVFGLILNAEMGAGKTTFTRKLLYNIGVNKDLPIVSPTFTFMNEYQIAGEWYAHLDLYRMEGQFELEEFGVFDARKFKGLIIEWPNFSEKSDELTITHELTIKYTDNAEQREYFFHKL